MTDTDIGDAVRKTIQVRCDVATAFRIWTEQVDLWWPKDHSRSGEPDITIVIEPRLGGRFYERTPSGDEYDWGKIVDWSPPERFASTFFLGTGPTQPTHFEVQFSATTDGTQVEIVHRGPDWIGALWTQNAPRYVSGWTSVLPSYEALCNAAATTTWSSESP